MKKKVKKLICLILAILIGLLFSYLIEFILSYVKDTEKSIDSEVHVSTEKNYYIYCYINSGIDKVVSPKKGYYLQESNKFLRECLDYTTGYGNVYVKDGYHAVLQSQQIDSNLILYNVSSVVVNKE